MDKIIENINIEKLTERKTKLEAKKTDRLVEITKIDIELALIDALITYGENK